uniref:Uncharacterized protein n=1 Tax=Rousettus aegyptiacus TaxID=9407 RepID=A0A7J8JI72_ROUAE|nr:hypothetical protein HJG63_010156 [Rousettus aegyptiacus]
MLTSGTQWKGRGCGGGGRQGYETDVSTCSPGLFFLCSLAALVQVLSTLISPTPLASCAILSLLRPSKNKGRNSVKVSQSLLQCCSGTLDTEAWAMLPVVLCVIICGVYASTIPFGPPLLASQTSVHILPPIWF